MLHPPIAEIGNPLPIIAFLFFFWATVAVVVGAASTVVLGPRRPAAVVLPSVVGFIAGMFGGGLSGALPFLVTGAAITALIQRRWLGEAGSPGPPAPEGPPWGPRQAARMVARRREQRDREAAAAREAPRD